MQYKNFTKNLKLEKNLYFNQISSRQFITGQCSFSQSADNLRIKRAIQDSNYHKHVIIQALVKPFVYFAPIILNGAKKNS